MSELTVYKAGDLTNPERIGEHRKMREILGDRGIRFEQWEANAPLTAESTSDEILSAYRTQVDGLMKESGFESVDVISLYPEHPQKDVMREKFLNEHIHTDDEVRFFVDGQGMFYLRFDDAVLTVLCEKGDLISVPSNQRHWFDMGPMPDFKCIRLFTDEAGWVAQMTGDDIANRYPRFE
jgi:1,2-dihydroxy-3-keto-5-methylthiopentene dioxygenase